MLFRSRVRCKTIEISIFNANGDSLPGPLIIGTFEKWAPETLLGLSGKGPLVANRQEINAYALNDEYYIIIF